ncbi:hydroxymethylbilane synthase [uncultured Draconibacterium sp.]|uniref:hydroxymethylbilane synthase n=1 Tax=uncultured Draconibacterium sp. TaxID=1573823 RepID=UPI0025E6D848|nr:hydroxymethylbilane synthase [uncultured Draconibacterium sp.]
MKQKITIATRGSRLALKQTEIVRSLLLKEFPQLSIEVLEVTTRGDIDQTTPLQAFGNTGVFVKGLEEKILLGEADIAVHSLKDVPSDAHPDLVLAAYPEREDVRDVLISRNNVHFSELKRGSVIGTSSPARRMQLQLLRPDLVFKNIRGNVDTRVEKVKNGNYDATILAAAGLKRLGYSIPQNSFFSLDEAVPSPGQGALVVQSHRQNTTVLALLEKINDPGVEKQVAAERKFMQLIGGGCRYPLAAHAETDAGKVTFRAIAHKPGWCNIEKVKIEIPVAKLMPGVEEIAKKIIDKNL